jgi:hypothetical protein
MNRSTASFAILAVLGAAAFASCAEDGLDRRVVKELGGKEVAHTLATAPRVLAYRVKPDPVKADAPEAKTAVAGYPVIGGAVALDAETSKNLRAVLLDPGAYEFGVAKACEFVPGVGVRFVGEERTIDVVFCFECDVLSIRALGSERWQGGGSFDPGRARFVAVMKQVFADDKTIQELKAKRR